MNDRACPRDGVRPVGHVGSRPQGEVPRAGRPYLEPLEARLLLDGTAAQQAMELFSVSPALFVENQGQWADPSVRYVHQGNGVNVAMTDAGPVFQLFRDDPANPQGPSGPPADRIDPEARNTQVLQFSASFVGAAVVVPVGVNRSDALFNYFLGDQSSWRSNVPGYEQVGYRGSYDGVDLGRKASSHMPRAGDGSEPTRHQVNTVGNRNGGRSLRPAELSWRTRHARYNTGQPICAGRFGFWDVKTLLCARSSALACAGPKDCGRTTT